MQDDAPAPIELDEDDGFIEAAVSGVSLRLDLYRTVNELARLGALNPGPDVATAYQESVAAYMQQLGYPAGSLRLASKFAEAIIARQEALEKKASPSPDSPDSTG